MTGSTEAAGVDAGPFDLPGRGRAAALCLHGLTGTPYEVRPVAEALARAGVRARGPALPGHNETPAALARVRHGDWIAAARAEIRALRAEHERVFVVGMSMGGLVALDLAAEGDVDAVVSIGAPLQLSLPVRLLVPLLKHLAPMQRKVGGADIRCDEARARHPSYAVMPLPAVHELMHLQRRVRSRLGRVTAPILIAHGALDRTARPGDAHVIHAAVASQVREVALFEASGHVVPVDLDGARLSARVAEFLGRHG